jgi:hypothetical protein
MLRKAGSLRLLEQSITIPQLLLITVIFAGVLEAVPLLRLNVVNTLAYHALGSKMEASERQRSLRILASLLVAKPNIPSPTDHTMVEATLKAEHYRATRDFRMAGFWYRVAACADPLPAIQDQLLHPKWVHLDTWGNMHLEHTPIPWRPRNDVVRDATVSVSRDSNGRAIFHMRGHSEEANAAFYWHGDLAVPYHPDAELCIWVTPGCLVTFEAATERGLTRYLGRREADGSLCVPFRLDGKQLKYLYLGIVHSDQAAGGEHACEAHIRCLTLNLTSSAPQYAAPKVP